ncbi:MAG: HlyD family efflux transporter periplasmic adaptor subunit [Ruminiclostridium sp.]|nr:HlyD family efflux transporter periplasmic adaptor subunit [Ruminiclostridium sp.]
MRRSGISAFAAVLAVIMSLSGCYFFPDEEKLLDPPVIAPDDVAYSTYTARMKDIESINTAAGYVRSKTEAECYFTDYTGQLKTIHVHAGDFVEKGDLIAEMNVGELEYLLEIQELRVQAAQLRYNSSGSQADKLDLEIEQSTLEMYRAQYAGAMIYAPVSGQVSFVIKLDPGTEIDPYRVVARIADPGKLYVEAEYTGDKDAFTVGDSVTLTVDGVVYDGKISYTPRTAAEEGSDNIKTLRAEFTGEMPPFGYLGKIADIKKVRERSENAVVIPKTLIKTDGDRQYIQVFDNGEKTERNITVGITNATEAEITSGLSAGEAVIMR